MDNQTISALPTIDSEVFADCESFLTDLSANDESMIAGGGIVRFRSFSREKYYEYFLYLKRRRRFRKRTPHSRRSSGRVTISS